MTGLGTRERFTLECSVRRTPKKISVLKKSAKYNCRKVILGTLGFELSFQKGCYKLDNQLESLVSEDFPFSPPSSSSNGCHKCEHFEDTIVN